MKKAAPAKKPAATKAPVKAPAAKAPVTKAAPGGKSAPPKKAAPKKDEPKEEEKKAVEEQKIEEEPPKIPEPPKDPVHGKCVVNFNHYNTAFPIIDGVMKWFDIDEEYAFSCVYEQGFFLKMYEGTKLEEKGEEVQVKGHTFLGCEDGKEYVCEAVDAPG